MEIDKKELKFAFLPTGPLQEISMDNGWGGEYEVIVSKTGKYL
jgi:hypothetical protein